MVTLSVLTNFISQEGSFKRGERLRVDENRARQLIAQGLAKVVAAPAETQPLAPAETKQEQKKSQASFALPVTPSTPAAASSSAPGPDAPSSASAAGRVSRRRKSTNAITRGSLPLQ